MPTHTVRRSAFVDPNIFKRRRHVFRLTGSYRNAQQVRNVVANPTFFFSDCGLWVLPTRIFCFPLDPLVKSVANRKSTSGGLSLCFGFLFHCLRSCFIGVDTFRNQIIVSTCAFSRRLQTNVWVSTITANNGS